MAVKITCIKKDNGFHENPYVAISSLGWLNEETMQPGISSRLQMYDFVQKGGVAYVVDALKNKVYLTTAETTNGTKYIKTIPDRTQADNLLKLPECP